MRYECIRELRLDKFDDDGFRTDKEQWVSVGSIWETQKSESRIIGDKDSIHLDRIFKSKKAKTIQWIEVTRETFEKHFKLVKEKENAMYQSEWFKKRETVRKIVCDKYGIEGDCTIDYMIDDIVTSLDNLKMF